MKTQKSVNTLLINDADYSYYQHLASWLKFETNGRNVRILGIVVPTTPNHNDAYFEVHDIPADDRTFLSLHYGWSSYP